MSEQTYLKRLSKRHARPLWTFVSLLSPVVGALVGLAVYLVSTGGGGHPVEMIGGLMTFYLFLVFGFFAGLVALARAERLWEITALGLLANSPSVLLPLYGLLDYACR